MSYVIDFDGLKVPVNNLEINRTPSFSFFWSVNTHDLAGVIHDDTKNFFQITFSTYNIKSLVEKILSHFKKGTSFSIITPYASFSDAIIHQATIDNDQISISLIASEPSEEGQIIKSDVRLALEANYHYARPGFVNFFQFGNYLAISTFPFNLERDIQDSLETVFKNDYWTVFKLQTSEKPQIIKYNIGKLTGYCYTILPELMTDVLLQPGHGNRYTYIFGVHPSCELAAYLRVEDLQTGEMWYHSGNQGTMELAPGSYKLTPIVVIPEKNPIYIKGSSTTIAIPKSQIILSFLSPLTLSLDETLKLRVNESLILQFDGWQSIQVNKDKNVDSVEVEIKFDYPGTFRCHVYSQDRNMLITTFTVNVYDTHIPQATYDYTIRIDSRLITSKTTVSANVKSYIAFSSDGKVLGRSSQTPTITTLSTIDDYQVKVIDVFFHSTPVVGKPVLMSVDGPISKVEVNDASVEQISDTLYKLTFNSDGYKAITLYLPNNKTLTKYVSVLPGFRKIISVSNPDSGQIICKTGDFYALIRSPTLVKLVSPNSTFKWTEYSFGLTNINVTLIKGSKMTDVQYRCLIYNPDSLKIVSYGRTLQLLALPHSEIDQILWYINDSFIGVGDTVTVPIYIPGGTYNVKAIVYSNDKVVKLTETVTVPSADVNRIQLSCQSMHPHIKPASTNRLVTIYNGIPEVTYEYLDSTLNICLDKYLYLEKFTYIGTVNDLSYEVKK